jgi:predicted NUDIX family NTP pyrophosphohydrolase
MAKVKQSAGILLYRIVDGNPEFLLAHPGGPFWSKKDAASWTIPKGEFDETEDSLDAAKREFEEETGLTPVGEFMALNPIKQKSGKIIYAWALNMDFDPGQLLSNSFEMEWPPKSGRVQLFPEIDRVEWFSTAQAKEKIIPGQMGFIDECLSICPD